MKQFFEIVDVTAREIMDLNFQNSLEVEITLDDETVGRAAAPSGMLNVNIEISEALLAMNALDQPSIDRMLLELDGSAGASRLGANALLAVSLACAKAAAFSSGLPLYHYVGGVNAKMIPVIMESAKDVLLLSEYPTLTRFLAAAASLRRTGKRLVVSAGDGETEDPVIADLAVALNAEGLVTKSSAVYNELMRIEEELFDVPEYPES